MDQNNDAENDKKKEEFANYNCGQRGEFGTKRAALKPLSLDNYRRTNQDRNDIISTPASILKRVRHTVGKENEESLVNNISLSITKSENAIHQISKKVRIISPIKSPLNNSIAPGMDRENILSHEEYNMDDVFEKRNSVNFKTCQWNVNDIEPSNTSEMIDCIIRDDEFLNEIVDIADEDADYLIEPLLQVGDVDGKKPIAKPEIKRRRNRKAFSHWLLVRFQPIYLSQAVCSLSPKQRKWVKATGFGSILSFKMNQYPQALSYYLALSFQAHTSTMCYEDKNILVTDDDVNEVLGLPLGKNRIPIMKSDHIEDIWAEQFKPLVKSVAKVTANMVCEAIKNSQEVDRQFKLNFLVLLFNILIEGPSNPYIRRTILGFTGDIDNCSQYNWCEYLINNLKSSTLAWNENPDKKYYTGSIPLLVYLYMDRVVSGKRQVRRKKPTYIGWSDILILDRQIADVSSNSFFHGNIALPLRYKDSDDESSYEDCTWNNNEYYNSDGEEVNCLDGKGTKNCPNNEACSIVQNQTLTDRDHTQSNSAGDVNISQILEEEIPRYVVDNLKVSMDSYDEAQNKCFMYLLSAKEMFKNNLIVNSLEERFVALTVRAEEFINKKLQKGENDGLQRCLVSSNKEEFVTNKNSSLTPKTINGSSHTAQLDDDLILSSQDLSYIDSLSKPVKDAEITPKMVVQNMESQSKTLPARNLNNSSAFKTPSSGQVFKLPLDVTLPTFNLGIDNVDVSNSSIMVDDHATVQLLPTGRPKREIKIPESQKSPFMDRFTNLHCKQLKKEEIDLWNWLHSNKRHPNRALFRWQNVTCYKVDFQSMKDGEMIMTSVMDVWSCFLNSQEDLRSASSPRRLFCYIETTLGSLSAFNEKTIDKTYKVFEENMNHIMGCYKTKINEVDMVFFPIFQANHYYVVCYNIKIPAIEILDNRKSNNTVKRLYGNKVVFLHKHFSSYLVKKNHPRARDISRLEPQRLVMHWQTTDNDVDCGVYAMRHMETYLGGGVRSWPSKLVPQGCTQARNLSRARILFTFKMLSSNLNSLYDIVLEEIKEANLLG